MTKLTKKLALEAAISAVANSNIKEYTIAGEDGVKFSAEEITAKLTEMWNALQRIAKTDGSVDAILAELTVAQDAANAAAGN